MDAVLRISRVCHSCNTLSKANELYESAAVTPDDGLPDDEPSHISVAVFCAVDDFLKSCNRF